MEGVPRGGLATGTGIVPFLRSILAASWLNVGLMGEGRRAGEVLDRRRGDAFGEVLCLVAGVFGNRENVGDLVGCGDVARLCLLRRILVSSSRITLLSMVFSLSSVACLRARRDEDW